LLKGRIRFIIHFNNIFKFNIKNKYASAVKTLQSRKTGIVTIRKTFCQGTANAGSTITAIVAVGSKNRINGNSAENYKLKDEDESTGGMVIPQGITSSWTRNSPEEWLFRRNLPAQGRVTHRRNGIPQEITSSQTRNPPRE
jgi:hypothetical protein